MFTLKYALISIAAVQISLSKPAKEDYILPKFCKPLEYTVKLFVPSDSLTESYNTYHGYEIIKFYVNKTTNYIALHSHHSYIQIGSILFFGRAIPSTSYSVNNITDILKINLNQPIQSGKTYILTIEYVATLTTSDLFGLYKKTYTDQYGKPRYYLSTMCAPTHARRIFPCFDEPAWKAKFTFIFTIPWRYEVRFNTMQKTGNFFAEEGLKIIEFLPTPKMSTYLVAFVISDFTCTTAAGSDEVAETRICSKFTTQFKRELAAEYAPRLLSKMNELIGFDYEAVLSHLDHVAIPHFESGAMENWGLILYREKNLLWDTDSNSDMQRIVNMMAHEIAHQWFGNLVTMEWWSEVFLNEGFGAYFEFYLTHEIFPEWQLDKQFVLKKMHVALTADASADAPVLQSNCYTEEQIRNRFHTINYNKGSSIIRMVEHFMKREHFFAGLQYYIKTFQFKTTKSEDLWQALNRSVVPSISQLPANFKTVMQTWINTTGFPLIVVSSLGNIVNIKQQIYPFSGKDKSVKWYIPISYSLSMDPDKFQNTTPKLWLTPFKSRVNITLPKNSRWIIFNNQESAYYRVMYDTTSLANIAEALSKDDFDGIGELNRAKIVDDLFSLARSSLLRYSTVFKTIEFLKNDTSYFSWYAAFEGFESLLLKVGYDSLLGIKVKKIILELMPLVFDSVPLLIIDEDNQIYTLKQVMVHEWACKLSFRYCNSLFIILFKQYARTGKKIYPNYKSIVYCNGIRYSMERCDWDSIWDAYTKTDSESERYTLLNALTCTNDESIIKEFLLMTINATYNFSFITSIRIYSSFYKGSDKGIHLVLSFFKNHNRAVADRYGVENLGRILLDIATRLHDPFQLKIYKEIGETVPSGLKRYIKVSLTYIEKTLQFVRATSKDLLEETSTAMSVSSTVESTVY